LAEFDSYPAGTPSWVDLSTPDPAKAESFYGGLFGWEVKEQGPEAGGYAMFTKSGKNVAGIGPVMGEGQPTVWTTYVTVDDADATIAKAKEAGGVVFVEPMDVLDVGRMAVFSDPTGAVIAIWQPKTHQGAQLANEADTFCWNELRTRDADKAKSFYAHVFGWGATSEDFEGMSYTMWQRGDAPVGGMVELPLHTPSDIAPHWLVYFAVDDCDATVSKATSTGAQVTSPPTDTSAGRMATLQDPSGAAFAVIKPPS